MQIRLPPDLDACAGSLREPMTVGELLALGQEAVQEADGTWSGEAAFVQSGDVRLVDADAPPGRCAKERGRHEGGVAT